MYSSNYADHGNIGGLKIKDTEWTDIVIVFNIVLPVALLLFALVRRGCQMVPWSTNFREVWWTISFPFRNFITFEDFIEPIGPALKPSRWMTRCLIMLSTLECAIQLGALIYLLSIYDTEFMYLISSVVGVATGVSEFLIYDHSLTEMTIKALLDYSTVEGASQDAPIYTHGPFHLQSYLRYMLNI
jgi:hypothetical protein